jgi:hypothetical protein
MKKPEKDSMSKRGQKSSSKQNKHTSHQSTSSADRSPFTKGLLLDQEDNTSLQGTSSSLQSFRLSSSQAHQRKPVRVVDKLEDIDQTNNQNNGDDEEEDQSDRRANKQEPNKYPSSATRDAITTTSIAEKSLSRLTSSPSSSWVNNSREQEATDLWSWLTSSRTISQEQQQLEDREDTLGLARHQRDLQARFSITFDKSTKQQKNTNKKDVEKVDGTGIIEREGSVKSLWYPSTNTAAFDLKRQDWITLSALTIATLGVRFWRISWPDEVL